MSKFGDYWASQCGNPKGVIGRVMTWAMNRANKVMYYGIIENMKPSEGMKNLDVGFGNGYLEKLIYSETKCSIYGIDISEDMVKNASENNKKGIKMEYFIMLFLQKKVWIKYSIQKTGSKNLTKENM